jgi:CRISPR-associated protein Cmr6
VFNKFVDRWSTKDNKFGLHEDAQRRSEKANWINKFCQAPLGNGTLLSQAAARIAKVAKHSISISKDEASPETPRLFTNTSRFVTGLGLSHPVENGFAWHHAYGVPYLPGSSVKGMIRAWAQHWGGAQQDEVLRLFGNDVDEVAQMGALIVFDALPVKPVQLICEILTPHDGGWRQSGPVIKDRKPPLSPGDWHDPVPIPFLAVDKGQSFQFALGATRKAAPDDVARGYELLAQALESIGAGAKTASGFGLFEPKSEFDVGTQVRVADSFHDKKLRGQAATIIQSNRPQDKWRIKAGVPGAAGGREGYAGESELVVIRDQ